MFANRTDHLKKDTLQPSSRYATTISRCRNKRRGAACVEFAFVVPFLFFLIFGSIEFSRMIMIKQSLTNAAREGCRRASLINTTDADLVEDTVRDYLKGSIANYTDELEVRVSIEPANVSGLPTGTPITTSVEVDCNDVSWMSAMFFFNAEIHGTATMNRE